MFASHSLTLPSMLPAEARRRPSGLNATPTTAPVCPRKVRTSFAGVGVPDPHSLVGTCGREAAAVGAKRQANDHARVAAKHADLLPGVGIPEPHGPVDATRCEAATVGAKRQAIDRVRVTAEIAGPPGRYGVPQPDGPDQSRRRRGGGRRG